MNRSQLLRLTSAPEIVVVDLADHALHALRLAILAEHPPLRDEEGFVSEEPPVQRQARELLRRARRLRRELDAYRHAVDLAVQYPSGDFPF
jgi:hypothetical protein